MREWSIEEPRGKKLMKRIGTPCLAVGSGTATIGGILTSAFGLHAVMVTVAGGSILICGLVATALGEIWFRTSPRLDYYRSRKLVREDDLQDLQRISEECSGGEVSTLSEKCELLQKNRDLFYGVDMMRPGSPKETVGYYAIYPLRKSVVTQLELGRRTRWYGEQASVEDICSPTAKPYGLYIGFVWGMDGKARAATLKHLAKELNMRYRRHSAFKLFTRPMTNEGMRLAKRHGFTRVSDGGSPELYSVVSRIWP